MENNVKPTFGSTVITTTEASNVPLNERKESGAIWERTSKANNRFLSIKLNMSKKALQELLAKSTTEEVSIGFVAFPNKSQNGDPKRPTFRIFEDQKK
jgi:hypothetical protein